MNESMSRIAQVSGSSIQNSGFRSEINALRAIAVLAVMAYHFGVPGFSGGFAGVDVFFVISGFLIASQILESIEQKTFSFTSFFSSRLRRIFPALFVVVIVCLVWGWFFDLPKEYINTNRHAVSALFFVSNLAFDGERGYFDAAAHTKALLHTWSLGVEGQFYLFLPILLLTARRFAKYYLKAVISLSLLMCMGWALYTNDQTPGKGFYLLSCRVWEFLAGVLLATHPLPNLNAALRNRLSVLGFGLLAVSFCYIDKNIPWPGIWTILPILGTSLAIIAGNANATSYFVEMRFFQRVGNISYSLYLWHWPVLVFVNALVTMSGRVLSSVDVLGMLLLTFVLGGVSWQYIERPIRVERHWWTNKRLSVFALAAIFAVFSFGLINVAMNGLPFRLPSYVQRAADATFINTPRDECFRRGDSTKEASEQFCVFGAVGTTPISPTIALWGDSHANQYLTALSDAAVHMNLSGIIATQSACSASKVDFKKTANSACEKFNQEVYRYLVGHPAIKTVVLGKWWADLHNEAILDLIRGLVKEGKKVVLIGVLPSPGFDVPERWSKQQINANHAIDLMTAPLNSQSLALEIREKTLAELSPQLHLGSVVYVDPLEHFCDEKVCRFVDGGQSNFRDDSHLAHSSSLKFVADFEDALKKLN
jgi:peptidoglycan/LPS O-acetylase OafA/YrhL